MTKQVILGFVFFISLCTCKAQNIVVTDVKATFFVPAHTDDKDEHTSITAALYTDAGKKVAALENCCGNIRYPDADYTSATYQLTMKDEIKKSEIQSGYFDIHITSKDNDKWAFTPTFQIFFSDGTKALIKGETADKPFTATTVSEKKPDAKFSFHL